MDHSEIFGEVRDSKARRSVSTVSLEDRLFSTLCALSSALENQCGDSLIARKERLDALEVIASAQSQRMSRAALSKDTK